MPRMKGPRTQLGFLRRKLGKTIFEMAVVELGVEVSAYRNWEYGYARPGWDGQRRLEKYFSVPWQELVELKVF